MDNTDEKEDKYKHKYRIKKKKTKNNINNLYQNHILQMIWK